MSYFLGFVPDRKTNYEIKKVLKEAEIIFNDLDIPVRWVKPNTYHITLYYLGEKYSYLNQVILKKKISKIELKKINASFNSLKVGFLRNYKELIYLDLKEGGDQLRELLLEIRKNVGEKDSSIFMPHLTIGRVSKDLSKEEYRNICIEVARVSKQLKLEKIQFTLDTLYLIEGKDGAYTFKTKFEA